MTWSESTYRYVKGHPTLKKGSANDYRSEEMIVSKGFTPWRESDGWWDGFSAQNPQGQRIFITDRLMNQMRRMLAKGHWPFDGEPSEQFRKRAGAPHGKFTRVGLNFVAQWPSEETAGTEPPKVDE